MEGILKFDFNKGKRIEADLSNNINENIEEKENSINKNIQTNKKEEIAKLAKPFLGFVEFVLSDKHEKLLNLKTTPFALGENRKVVENYTNEELMSWLNRDESEFSGKASLYRAIYEEMKSRLPESLKGSHKIG